MANILTGGTPSADTVVASGYEADKAVDGNTTATRWTSTNSSFPHWWKYDFGSSAKGIATAMRVYPYWDANGATQRAFKIQASNDDSNWTDLYTGTFANEGWNGSSANGSTYFDFSWSNTTAYRYYRLYVTTNYRTDGFCAIWELTLEGSMETLTNTSNMLLMF